VKTPRPPRPTQTNGVQVPAGHRVRDRLGSGHSSNLVAGSDGASGPRMTRRTAVLALGAGLATTLGGCGLRLGKGSPASLPTASTAESARDGLARQATLISSTASVVSQASGTDATTAALAAKLSVSEAALYRHFASKAQMFEGLIEFIESTLFGLINQITREEEHGLAQVQQITNLLLTFSERNPGMTRVLVGDALINEDDRLQVRINQLTDRLELSLKQCFRTAMVQEQLPADTDAGARADLVLSYVLGRWARYAKGGFKRMPTENVSIQIGYFVS